MKNVRLVPCVLVLPVLAACGGEAKPAAKSVEAPPALSAPAASAQRPDGAPPQVAPKATQAEGQKKALLALQAAYDAKDPKAYAELYSEGGALIALGPQGFREEAKGRPAIEASQKALFERMETKGVMTRVLQRDELAVYEWIASGTDKESGKKVSFRGAGVLTFDTDGKITKEYSYVDPLTPAMQVGKFPGKPRETAAPGGETAWVVAKKDGAEDKQVELVKGGWPVAWPKKDKKAIDALFADDVVFEPVAQPSDAKGRAETVRAFEAMTKAVPDASVTLDTSWSAGPFVVSAFTVKGTQKAPFGLASKVTGKPLVLHGLEIAEVRGGKVARATWYTSNVELLGQLGLLPEPKAPAKTSMLEDRR